MPDYPWYDLVSSKARLLQGDFVFSCPVLVPMEPIKVNETSIQGEKVEYDVIIMSQSCDLQQKKIDLVLVCPVFTLDDFSNEHTWFRGSEGKEALRRGYVASNHLLSRCDKGGFANQYLVVDFKSVFGVPFEFLEVFAQKSNQRLRLLPPYREHLSQAFARFFMRVGLPLNIAPFK